MSYKPYKGKKRRRLLLLLSFFLFLLSGVILFFKQFGYIDELEKACQAKEKKLSALAAEQEKFVYVTKRGIKAGERITSSDVSYEKVYSSMEDTAFAKIGESYKISRIDIPADTHVLAAMVSDEEIDTHIREEEFQVFYLSKSLSNYNTVDIRIFYPNGENYIVLSKKVLKGLDWQTASCSLWLDEQETLMVSSAIVDAYQIPGTYLYTTKYIEASVQDASVITYTPSKEVITLIEKSPNILQQAKRSLSRTVRELLALRMESFAGKEDEKLWNNFPGFVNGRAGQTQQMLPEEKNQEKEDAILYVD